MSDMKYYIVFDPERCCACHACSVACMDQNDTDVEAGELPLRRVFNEELGRDVLDCAYLSAACAHCDDAPCVMACPFGAPRYLPDSGKMVKCDGCNERLKSGLMPACVRACTFGALTCMNEEEYQNSVKARALHAMLLATGHRS